MTLARRALSALLLWAAACAGGAPEQAAAPTAAPAERGRALYRNKGCVTCHQHAQVEGDSGILRAGPNLTTYRADPAALRAFLADPQASKPNSAMPNFGLSAAEIEDLIAFLNKPG